MDSLRKHGEDLRSTAQFDQVARFVHAADLEECVRISADPARHTDWLQQDIELGIDRIYAHNAGRNQDQFIDIFGQRDLPL